MQEVECLQYSRDLLYICRRSARISTYGAPLQLLIILQSQTIPRVGYAEWVLKNNDLELGDRGLKMWSRDYPLGGKVEPTRVQVVSMLAFLAVAYFIWHTCVHAANLD